MPIRRLTADDADADAFQDLHLAALQESPAAFSSSHEEERERPPAQIAQYLSGSPERVIVGAFAEGQLVGVVGVGREPAKKQRHIGFIRSMYVAPQARGQRLGSALLREALTVAAGWSGLEQLTLVVNATNAPAIALYLRAGFVEFGRHPRALCFDGVHYDELHTARQSAA